MSEAGEGHTQRAVIQAPWGREVTVTEIVYEGGMRALRLRIRENKRFTDLELDPDTAKRLAEVLTGWAEAAGK